MNITKCFYRLKAQATIPVAHPAYLPVPDPVALPANLPVHRRVPRPATVLAYHPVRRPALLNHLARFLRTAPHPATHQTTVPLHDLGERCLALRSVMCLEYY
jgi:hypothetical protein